MNEITIVFPHQLFADHPAIHARRPVWLIEESLFFTAMPFHRQKLVLHRASMRAYADLLRSQGISVEYIEHTQPEHDIRKLGEKLRNHRVDEIHIAEVCDDWLNRRLIAAARRSGCRIKDYTSPGFWNRREDIRSFFEGRQRFHQTDFYIHQRKSKALLLDPEGKPFGGKWTYDTDNRKKFPKGQQIPKPPKTNGDVYTKEAVSMLGRSFPDNPGHPDFGETEGYPWAWTHAAAEQLLDRFLHERLRGFGDYEDAMVRAEEFLHHSVLTPMLNIGLLTPQHIIERTIDFATGKEIPLNDLEGFIRQITGWREFIRGVYLVAGREQRIRNYWGFNRKIPASFWTGDTGIAPVDDVIRKILKTGYAHHIERLMVLGNFFLLCEFDPDEVYHWFMSLFIDAYDWVMVPNIYGMTQFADGGMMTTKPYISGSNYILKMSDWKDSIIPATGNGWTETWDALFWRFMDVHRDFFLSNPRLGMLVRTFDLSPLEKKEKHRRIAEDFLTSLELAHQKKTH
jgi:deoxyribodipyrimidine photolyase-related protein